MAIVDHYLQLLGHGDLFEYNTLNSFFAFLSQQLGLNFGRQLNLYFWSEVGINIYFSLPHELTRLPHELTRLPHEMMRLPHEIMTLHHGLMRLNHK